MKSDAEFLATLTRVRTLALLVGSVSAGLCVLGGYLQPSYFFPAYLVAYLFWLGIALGCLAVSLLHHLTGGAWGQASRRVLEAGYSTLPLLALLFLPIVLGLRILYVWARPEIVAADEILARKAPYLNANFFQLRAVLYFVIWIASGTIISWLSSGTDEQGEPLRRRRLALVSGPALILWGLTITFAAVDWGMSIEPHWYSSAYGVLFIAGQGVSAMAFAIIILVWLRNYRILAAVATGPRLHDLGNLLLAFLMIWSYISFTQFLIIWTANLPEETPWYLHRSRGGWQVVVVMLAGMHFLMPFLFLLSRAVKRRSRQLAGVAALLLVMRLVDLYWLIMPAFSSLGLFLNWQILLTVPAIGGLWCSWFAWRLPERAAIPVFDLPPEQETPHELVRPATS